MKSHANAWNSMKTHGACVGILGIPREMHGNPWESMENAWNPWNPWEMHGNPWEMRGSPWNPIGTTWGPLEIHGGCVGIREIPWKSTKLQENHWENYDLE